MCFGGLEEGEMRIPYNFCCLTMLFATKAEILIQPLLNIYTSILQLMTIYSFLRNHASFNALDDTLSREIFAAFYEVLQNECI